jgi:exopolysaccharide production protein ExoQ
MQRVALILCVLYVLGLVLVDMKRRRGVSKVTWAVVLWIIMISSRPISTWFTSGGGGSYDEGSPIERMIYFVLLGIGLATLWKRRMTFREFRRTNMWLLVFFAYWALSIFWSDAPFIALKRWVKDVGNIVMVMVLLTERDPALAIKAVFARCSFLLIPFSFVLIKFFSDLGRTYHVWSGEMMFTGVATHKNTLGTLVLVCGLFFMWDVVEWHRNHPGRRKWIWIAADGSVCLLSLWLLLKAHSATALVCGILGAAIYAGLHFKVVQRRVKHLEWYVIGGVTTYWLTTSVFDVKRFIIEDLLGRDMTLTTRTEVWPMLIKMNSSPLLGEGFNSFWSGERLEKIYNELHIIQAHNGYIETYLNGGFLGVVLLIALVIASMWAIKRDLRTGLDYARVRMMFLVIAIVYDFTEAAFNKMGIVWFAMLLAIVQLPRRWPEEPEPAAETWELDYEQPEEPAETQWA